MQISAGKQNLCIFYNLMIAKLYIYTNLKNFFWKVQHFGVLDCVYSEGIFCGVSSGGAGFIAEQIAKDNPNAVVVFIVCDRGDRYLSTGLFGVDDDL